jgi:lysyl-tRNA synthetase class 2
MLRILNRVLIHRPIIPLNNRRFSNNSIEETLDPTKYYENRIKSLKNITKYPYNFRPSTSIKSFLQTHSNLTAQQNNLEHKHESLAGRITSIRKHGKHTFIDVREEHIKLQIICEQLDLYIKRGDIVSVTGVPFRTQKGELSIKATVIKMLAPCLHMLPEYQNLKEVETRYRKRYLDMIVNPDTVAKLRIRSKVIQFLRSYLIKKDFIEVETPSLSTSAGGAIAVSLFLTSEAL